MSQNESFHSMSNMPSYGGQMMNGGRGGRMMPRPQVAERMCSLPALPMRRCYCQPAPFTSLDGQTYQRLVVAYGNSMPCGGGH